MRTLAANAQGADPNLACTAVLGGFGALGNFEKAQKWLSNKLWEDWVPVPVDIHDKGDLKSVIFAKFKSQAERDTAIGLIKSSNDSVSGTEVWAKPEVPLEQRVVKDIAFGAKHVMSEVCGGIDAACGSKSMTAEHVEQQALQKRWCFKLSWWRRTLSSNTEMAGKNT